MANPKLNLCWNFLIGTVSISVVFVLMFFALRELKIVSSDIHDYHRGDTHHHIHVYSPNHTENHPRDCHHEIAPANDKQCPLNAHWENCTGERCHCQFECAPNPWMRTCFTPHPPTCVCNEGFHFRVLNATYHPNGAVMPTRGDCVPASQCPPPSPRKCGANAHWKHCARSATNCFLNCANYRKERPHSCNLNCNFGCDCDEGFVFKDDQNHGDCIRPYECQYWLDS